MPTSFTIHMINEEPRILDTDLAARLNYRQPVKIRDTIKRASEELARYGVLKSISKPSGARGGGPIDEYYLNEGQAIRLVTLENSFETPTICEAINKAFSDHRRSQVSALDPTPDVAAILSILRQMAETLALLTKHMVSR
jgi:hypothetical protein